MSTWVIVYAPVVLLFYYYTKMGFIGQPPYFTWLVGTYLGIHGPGLRFYARKLGYPGSLPGAELFFQHNSNYREMVIIGQP